MTTEQELNEKLLKFAGFTKVEGMKHYWNEPNTVRTMHFSDGHTAEIGKRVIPPEFHNDMNACFKWLVPNVKTLTGIEFAGSDDTFTSWLCKLWYGIWADRGSIQVKQDYYEAEAETPAQALCQAIDKLIEAGVMK